MFKKIATFVFFCMFTLLAGCSGTPFYGPMTAIHDDKTVDIGSYVQWNNEYAVTAKHVKYVPNIVYVSKDYDLVFFKHPSTATVRWADTHVNENLVSKGFPFFPKRNKELSLAGQSVDINLTMDNLPHYYLIDALLVAGMSGGPVLNSRNEVVGINIGYTKKLYNINNKTQHYSVYLSHQGIQKEWIKFQEINQD